MAEIVDKYIIETQQAQSNLNNVAKELENVSAQSKKTSSQVQTDMVSAVRGGQQLTKQFNGLNLAVSQFARELPNAAISAQTFFISISNQFGQLQDAIARINQQNAELARQGLKTQSVFKQLASSILSFNTLLNVGVVLLVLYGKEIGNLISSLFKGSQAIDKAVQRFETFNKALDSKSVLKAISDINDLRINIDLARQGLRDKNEVIDQYNKSIGETTGQVASLDEAEKALVKNGQAYIRLTLLKAAANLANEEAAQASVDAMKETLKEEEQLRRDALAPQFTDAEGRGLEQFFNQARQTEIRARRAQSEQRIKDLQEVANRFATEAAKIAQENNFDFLGDITTDEEERERAEREAIERMREFWRLFEFEAAQVRPKGIITPQFGDITGATEAALPDNLEASIAVNVGEMDTNQLLDELIKSRERKETGYTKFLEEELKRRLKLQEAAADEQKRIDELVRDRGIEILAQGVNSLFELRQANAQAVADEEIRRLEEQRDTQLENDQLTAEQREKIQEEFEQKRAEIMNRNAQVQRQLDLSQILVNTAIAVIRALAIAKTPAEGAALAALAAIEGAIQYGFASAQPLPKFAEGTDRVLGGKRGVDSVHALLMPDEAVIKAKENMRYPGLAKAWNDGRLDQFLAMKYIEPALEEAEKKAIKVNNQFHSTTKVNGISDKRIVKGLSENALVNMAILKELRKNKGINGTNKRLWN